MRHPRLPQLFGRRARSRSLQSPACWTRTPSRYSEDPLLCSHTCPASHLVVIVLQSVGLLVICSVLFNSTICKERKKLKIYTDSYYYDANPS